MCLIQNFCNRIKYAFITEHGHHRLKSCLPTLERVWDG